MTEEETLAFDPSLKKKKKKKKAFDLDAALAEDGAATSAAPAEEGGAENGSAAATENGAAGKEENAKEAVNIDDLDLESFDLESFGTKKKKKKRPGLTKDATGEGDDSADKENEAGSDPWTGSDRDYTYDELLKRIFKIISDKNPDQERQGARRFVMRPPQVVRSGTKKTAFVNFMDIAKTLHRQPKHLLAFLSAELGTVGTIDGSNQLILKGKFQQRNIETVLRKYIKEYVTCHTCRSPDTILTKEGRLFFLQCMTCQAKCSVQSIKTGFQAITTKRTVMRAKQ